MLLQLFVDYQCISMSEIVHWYLKEDSIDKIIGKKVDKTWAKRFVKQHGYGLISKSILTYLPSFFYIFPNCNSIHQNRLI
jgi:hypothetical protein